MRIAVKSVTLALLFLLFSAVPARADWEEIYGIIKGYADNEWIDAVVARLDAITRCEEEEPPVEPTSVTEYNSGVTQLGNGSLFHSIGVAEAALSNWWAAANWMDLALGEFMGAKGDFDQVFP